VIFLGHILCGPINFTKTRGTSTYNDRQLSHGWLLSGLEINPSTQQSLRESLQIILLLFSCTTLCISSVFRNAGLMSVLKNLNFLFYWTVAFLIWSRHRQDLWSFNLKHPIMKSFTLLSTSHFSTINYWKTINH
jgi:hypothetical protein